METGPDGPSRAVQSFPRARVAELAVDVVLDMLTEAGDAFSSSLGRSSSSRPS